ncbi:hypothetical protein D3C87_1663990 [compost metagenome]
MPAGTVHENFRSVPVDAEPDNVTFWPAWTLTGPMMLDCGGMTTGSGLISAASLVTTKWYLLPSIEYTCDLSTPTIGVTVLPSAPSWPTRTRLDEPLTALPNTCVQRSPCTAFSSSGTRSCSRYSPLRLGSARRQTSVSPTLVSPIEYSAPISDGLMTLLTPSMFTSPHAR